MTDTPYIHFYSDELSSWVVGRISGDSYTDVLISLRFDSTDAEGAMKLAKAINKIKKLKY